MNRKRWRVCGGPLGTYVRYFDTRQEAVAYANAHYERTGNVAEIEERIRPNRKLDTEVKVCVCTKKCVSCAHCFVDGSDTYCGYILRTGRPRLCPAGKGCTEYTPRKRKA